MTLQKNDFIEIEFTGKNSEGEVFDSNIKEEVEKINPEAIQSQAKPFVFALGQGMFLKGIDDFLIGKSEDQKEFHIELKPENAFGNRNSQQVKMFPLKVFKEHNINPVPGVMFNFDGKIAKILSVSGGRVIVDFNHPLAGKDVFYDIKILRKVTDINEKVKALNEFFFKKNLDFEVKKSENKLIFNVDEQTKKITEFFKDKYKEILGLDLEFKEIGTNSKEESQKTEKDSEKKQNNEEFKEQGK